MPLLAINERQQVRKGALKKGVSSDDCRRKREDKTLSVRKNKREDNLRKRRNLSTPSTPRSSAGPSQALVPAAQTAVTATIGDLPAILQDVASQDRERRFNAVKKVRKLLSKEQAPPALEVIQAGLVPILVRFLSCTEDPKIQFEAAWALTNISSTEHTAVVVEQGAMGPLCQLLRSGDPEVREQCIWCLGNVAGDGPRLRDMVLKTEGSVESLLLNIAHPHSISMLRNTTWTLSNFCRGKPQAALELVRPFLPSLLKLIEYTDTEVVSDASWALSYISDGANTRIEAVRTAGVIPQLIKNLGHEKVQVITPSLRTIGNIASGDDKQTQAIIEGGVLDQLERLLGYTKRSIRKEACWTLSNIAAGNDRQIAQLMRVPALIKKVIEMTEQDEWEVRKEAAWVISNICTGGSGSHIKQMVELGALTSLISLLDVADAAIVGVSLDAIHSVLKKAPRECDYEVLLDELEGVEKIENLQHHENEDIYNKAVKIIEEYYSGEDEDENTAPQEDESGSAFSFGVNSGNVFGGNANNAFSF